MSSNRANTEVKATLTHTSISPSSCSTWSATLSRARASAVSTTYVAPVPPRASTSRRAPSRPRAPRASSATGSPRGANCSAGARPIPPEAPGTTTTRGRAGGRLETLLMCSPGVDGQGVGGQGVGGLDQQCVPERLRQVAAQPALDDVEPLGEQPRWSESTAVALEPPHGVVGVTLLVGGGEGQVEAG